MAHLVHCGTAMQLSRLFVIAAFLPLVSLVSLAACGLELSGAADVDPSPGKTPPATVSPPPANAADASGGASASGSDAAAPVGQLQDDAGVTSAPPPHVASADAGSASADAGNASKDAGSAATDTGSPGQQGSDGGQGDKAEGP